MINRIFKIVSLVIELSNSVIKLITSIRESKKKK